MSDMIERVAKAICQSKSCEGFMCCQHPANLGRIECPVKAGGYDDAARAAIEAMREPSPLELYPGVHAYIEVETTCRPVAFRVGWNAVIDAALSKATPHLPSGAAACSADTPATTNHHSSQCTSPKVAAIAGEEPGDAIPSPSPAPIPEQSNSLPPQAHPSHKGSDSRTGQHPLHPSGNHQNASGDAT